ncbi:hypothetical protein NIES37_51550 [Tolypothrix tenuis PCC 7101]|uniref:Uncharacterized protein n=1 Tax=Tolypothrix tenuis PCC 7101 TaxID=231146 RepID=A0A1Z4N612_9CYAN|nr:hypothetical protein [Aulosira sp. FACHB-113]BAZ01156.1 hypothetical protein NIES37_51550 [Tolypothrix tenuis PCC 7101]BAZ74922.1 hypothetical protein NIES50_35010 [Aulosira laxa NIES-50]
MNPEAKHIVSELRSEFYSLFAAAMKTPVKISSTSYSSNSPIASWIDNREQLNYVNIYAYTAPDEINPLRPFILRLAINKSALQFMMAKKWQKSRGLNLLWEFELTILPTEILDFLPWIVSLVEAQNQVAPSLLQPPPHPFELKVPNFALCNNLWTLEACLLTKGKVMEPAF